MASVQSTILKCVLLEKGLTEKQAEDIGLLLLATTESVQETLYYKCLGYPQDQIGLMIDRDQSTICRNIKKMKKSFKSCILC